MTKAMHYGLAALLAGALLAGCGGGGGEPTVTQTVHDDLQAELDAALAELAETEGERDTAQAATARLNAQLLSANADVTRLTAELATANTNVETLRTTLADTIDQVTELTEELSSAATEITELAGERTTAQARVTELETLIGDATNPTATSLRGQIAKLTVDLAAEEAKVAALTGQLSDAEDERDEALEELEELEEEAEAEPTPTTPTTTTPTTTTPTTASAEATQRAKNMLTAFGGPAMDGSAPPTTLALTDSPVTITAMTRGSLRLMHGGYSPATLSGTGTRSAIMALIGTGDTGKTVVYTDRELTRRLLDHYGSFKPSATAVQFEVDNGAALITTGVTPAANTNPGAADNANNVAANVVADKTTAAYVSVTHGLQSALSATAETLNGAISTDAAALPTDRTLTRQAAFFGGSIHGVGGQFRCGGTGITNCMVTMRGTYVDNDPVNTTTDENRLEAVDVLIPTGATLFFRPSSAAATVSLCDDPVLCTAGTDMEYMVFGYWRENPASPAGPYQFTPFADVIGTPTTTVAAGATYDGTAVGAYVEKDPSTAVDTYRQGEFTADLILESDGTNLSGTIDDFVTTPTEGSTAPRTADRWVITLDDAAHGAEGNVMVNLPGGGTDDGQWIHAFVPRRTNAGAGDPPAVVGQFDARIPNSVAIVGSFGGTSRGQ